MSYPRYPVYKDSGVEWLGEIPAHWETTRLKRFIAFITSGSRGWSQHYADNGAFFIRISNLTRNSIRLNLNELQFVNPPNDSEGRRTRIQKDDVLISITAYIGSVAIVDFDIEESYVNQHIALVRLVLSSVDPKWLAYFLFSTAGQSQFITLLNGGTKDGLALDDVANQLIPTLPISEQKTITCYLDREVPRIDLLIAKQQEMIARLQEKRRGLISHAVTRGLNPDAPLKDSGVEWLGMVPEHWKVWKLKYVKEPSPNSFVDGPFGSNLKSEHFIDDGEVFVIESEFAVQGKLDMSRIKMISREHFDTIRRSEAKSGDIIIAKIGANFGYNHILPDIDGIAVISGNSLKLTLDKQHYNAFVHYALLALKYFGEIDLQSNTTAQPALSLGALNNLIFVSPPLSEQCTIAAFIDRETAKIDTLIAKAQASIDLLNEHRTALISAAVTGKIDVRGL